MQSRRHSEMFAHKNNLSPRGQTPGFSRSINATPIAALVPLDVSEEEKRKRKKAPGHKRKPLVLSTGNHAITHKHKPVYKPSRQGNAKQNNPDVSESTCAQVSRASPESVIPPQPSYSLHTSSHENDNGFKLDDTHNDVLTPAELPVNSEEQEPAVEENKGLIAQSENIDPSQKADDAEVLEVDEDVATTNQQNSDSILLVSKQHTGSYPQPHPASDNRQIVIFGSHQSERSSNHQHTGSYPSPWSRNGRYAHSPSTSEIRNSQTRSDSKESRSSINQDNISDKNTNMKEFSTPDTHLGMAKDSLLNLSVRYQLAQKQNNVSAVRKYDNKTNRDARWIDASGRPHHQIGMRYKSLTAIDKLNKPYRYQLSEGDKPGKWGYPVDVNRPRSDNNFASEKAPNIWSPRNSTTRAQVQFLLHDPNPNKNVSSQTPNSVSVSSDKKELPNGIKPYNGYDNTDGLAETLLLNNEQILQFLKGHSDKIKKLAGVGRSTQTDVNEGTQTDIKDILEDVYGTKDIKSNSGSRKNTSNKRNFSQQWPPEVSKSDQSAQTGDSSDNNPTMTGLGFGEKQLVLYLRSRLGMTLGPFLFEVETEGIGLPRPASIGINNRQSGSHSLNEFSSRSHAMLTMMIDSDVADPDDPNLYITKHGKLTFVDLAGSEKVKDAQASNEHLVESNNINKSLLVLGKCISALSDPKKRQGHIPYRDSKLTKLLADSLGGNGVTLMICIEKSWNKNPLRGFSSPMPFYYGEPVKRSNIACISPSQANVAESMNTLRYANRAKRIRNKPLVKMDPREQLIMSMKRELKMLKKENEYLRQQLEFPAEVRDHRLRDPAVMRRELTNLMQQSDNQQMPPINQGQTEVIDHGLYEMLQEYMIENESLRKENTDLQGARESARRDQQILAHDNERLMRKLEELERLLAQSPVSFNSGLYSSRHSSHLDSLHSDNPSPMGFAPPIQWQQPSFQMMVGQPPMYYISPLGTPPHPQMTKPPSPSHKNGKTPRRQAPVLQTHYPSRPPHRLVDSFSHPAPQGLPAQQQPPPPPPPQKNSPRQSLPRATQEETKYSDQWQQRVEYYNNRNMTLPGEAPHEADRRHGSPHRQPASNPGTRPQSKVQNQPGVTENQPAVQRNSLPASPRPVQQPEVHEETPEEMNERLQQELLELQSQIRSQHQQSRDNDRSRPPASVRKSDQPNNQIPDYSNNKKTLPKQEDSNKQGQTVPKPKARSNIPQPRKKYGQSQSNTDVR